MEEFWIPLFIRMVVTAAVVLAATAAAERAGPFWAALIGAFPTSAGPAYVMLALKEDAAFIAASATYSLASLIALAPYVVTVIYLAPRTNVVGTLAGGLAVWVAVAYPISQIAWTPPAAFAVTLAVFAVGIWITRSMTFEVKTIPSTKPRWFELPLRAFVVGLFVAMVVTLSDALGTIGTGIGAAFPIVFSSLTAILHIRLGGALVALTMQSALRVVSIMIFAFFALHYAVLWWGEAWGLTVSLLVSIVMAMVFVAMNRGKARAV